MQKHISIRRSAQKLAKSGQIAKAIDAYQPLLNSGESDPYDHLYVGDLHERIGRRDEAVSHYEAAIRAYSKLGFHRNGIALCRKIIRLKPEQISVYRFLGELYAADELYGDALSAYLSYLEKASQEERVGDNYRETLAAAVSIAPRNAEMALRLATILEEVDRLDEAAELLVRASDHARAEGAGQLAADLRARADAIDPGAALRVGSLEPEAAGSSTAPDVGRVDDTEISLDADDEDGLDEESAGRGRGPMEQGSATVSASGGDAPMPGEIELDLEAGDEETSRSPHTDEAQDSDLEMSGSPRTDGAQDADLEMSGPPRSDDAQDADLEMYGSPPSDDARNADGDDVATSFSAPRRPSDPGAFGEIDLDALAGEQDASGPAETAEVSDRNEAAGEDLGGDECDTGGSRDDGGEESVLVIPEDASEDAIDFGAEETERAEADGQTASAEAGGLADAAEAGGLADPAKATREAVAAEQWTSARKRVEEWIRQDPVSVEAVENLVEISKALQDNAGIVRGLTLKGDLLIRDGDLSAAVGVFREVLRRSPTDETALRRMERFRELGVADAGAGDDDPGPVKAVLEARDTVIDVRDEAEGAPRDDQDWMEIGALLDEFREGVRQQVGENDPQAHYDLGVSHQEMGLLEEAVEEFDTALACSGLVPELELRIRELRGKCLAQLERHREAIHEFRQALEIPDLKKQECAGLTYLLGLEHVSVGELDEAKECMREVLRIRPDFEDATRQLEALESGAA